MKTFLLSFLVYYTLSTGGINGKIIDKNTSEELAGVRVIVNNKDTVYTDFNGEFKVKSISRIYKIEMSYPSYEKNDFILLNR